ncbi:MAG: hypothetical protein JSS79_18150 [Bacteroidetes bacterium]|nr:hypothetical protein [Bacteroidota bacterium]
MSEEFAMPKYLFTVDHLNTRTESHSSLIGIDVSIVRIEEDDSPPEFFFTSKHLDDLTDPKEVWAKGLYLLALYKGASNICTIDPFSALDFESRLSFVRLYYWGEPENITPDNPHLITPEDPFNEEKINCPLLIFESPSSHFINNSIYKSRRETKIRNLLLQFGNGLGWINLYAILDSLETYCSKNKFSTVLSNCGIAKSDLNTFTGIANNFGLLGVVARHGDKKFATPKKSMNLKEAQSLMLKITREYLGLEFGLKWRQ